MTERGEDEAAALTSGRKLREAIEDFLGGPLVHDEGVLPPLDAFIADALRAAEARGEARGIERATEIVENEEGWEAIYLSPEDNPGHSYVDGWPTYQAIAAAIRSLAPSSPVASPTEKEK